MQDVQALAKHFKISKNTDVLLPLSSACDALRVKIQERASKSRAREFSDSNGSVLLMSGEVRAGVGRSAASHAWVMQFQEVSLMDEFFPDSADLAALVKALVYARQQHCNSHHVYLRGQWAARDSIVRLAGNEEVLSLPLDQLVAGLKKA